MEATRLALALLVGSLVLGLCLSKPAEKGKRLQRRHEARQFFTNCTDVDFECISGDCIPGYWECDGIIDCPDGEDEPEGCLPTPSPCEADDFICDSGECIPDYWECDVIVDCPGGEDEVGCSSSSDDSWDDSFWDYSSYYYGGSDYCDFQCYSGDCIYSSWVCDGWDDCGQGEDEYGCDTYFYYDLLHYCLLSDVVVPTWMACDRIIDCPFGDDEWLGCYGIHDGLGFGKKKRSAREIPSALRKVAEKHMKTEKSLTSDQKEILDIINEKQSEMKKGRLAAKKALVL